MSVVRLKFLCMPVMLSLLFACQAPHHQTTADMNITAQEVRNKASMRQFETMINTTVSQYTMALV